LHRRLRRQRSQAAVNQTGLQSESVLGLRELACARSSSHYSSWRMWVVQPWAGSPRWRRDRERKVAWTVRLIGSCEIGRTAIRSGDTRVRSMRAMSAIAPRSRRTAVTRSRAGVRWRRHAGLGRHILGRGSVRTIFSPAARRTVDRFGLPRAELRGDERDWMRDYGASSAAGMLNDPLPLTSPPSRYSASIERSARVSNSRVASPRRFFHR
jgi:hypothetical protein